MALLVEDGTGKTEADAYVTLAEFRSYCSNRAMRYEAEDYAIEAAIRSATEWIDTQARYKGARLKATQMREFPRSGLSDWSGYEVTGVPSRVKWACCEAAYKALTEPLYQDLDRGGMVTSESVGAVSVSYAADAPAGKVFMAAVNMLKPYVRGNSELKFSPMEAPASGGVGISIGMHDNPGHGSTSDPLE